MIAKRDSWASQFPQGLQGLAGRLGNPNGAKGPQEGPQGQQRGSLSDSARGGMREMRTYVTYLRSSSKGICPFWQSLRNSQARNR